MHTEKETYNRIRVASLLDGGGAIAKTDANETVLLSRKISQAFCVRVGDVYDARLRADKSGAAEMFAVRVAPADETLNPGFREDIIDTLDDFGLYTAEEIAHECMKTQIIDTEDESEMRRATAFARSILDAMYDSGKLRKVVVLDASCVAFAAYTRSAARDIETCVVDDVYDEDSRDEYA